MNTTQTTTKTETVNCGENHMATKTTVVRDFGLKDEKGRAVCGVLVVMDHGTHSDPNYYTGIRGHVQAGRNGEGYGASQGSRQFASMEAALAYAEGQWAKQAKAYAKKYGAK